MAITQELERAFALAEDKRETLIGLLREIISINTCVPPGENYEAIVDCLEPKFKALAFDTERVIVPEANIRKIPLPLKGPRVNLVATKYSGKEPVSIYAHLDTVPIEQQWSLDPFVGIIRGDRMYGRGASDMKGEIAALLVALQIMCELDLEPKYDLNCLLGTDEEIGVYPGLYHLALKGYVKGHFLCLEGWRDPINIVGYLGMVDVTVTTLGKSCASAMNFLGVNAVEEMVPILEELMKLKAKVEKRKSRVPALPMPKAQSNMMTPMFNLDIIKGGGKSNIIPAECKLTINRRYIIEEDYEKVVAEIEEAIEKGRNRSKALDIKVRYLHVYPAIETDAESVYAKKMRKANEVVQGRKEEDFVKGGIYASTDLAFVSQVLQTDKFVFLGPYRKDSFTAHGADEYVYIRDLVSMTKELIYYLTT